MSPPSTAPTISHDLLNRITGAGLSATYRFTRTVSIFSPKMVSVELQFTNTSDKPITNLKITDQVATIPSTIFNKEYSSNISL